MTNVNEYTLINYFDVWGNAKDGWEVNNQCVEIDDLIITNDVTDKDVLDYLVSVGFLTTSDMRKVKLENLGEDMEIYEVKGHKPIGCLRMRRR